MSTRVHCDKPYCVEIRTPGRYRHGWWVSPDGQDWCQFHKPCMECGHDHRKHVGPEGDATPDDNSCIEGEERIWENDKTRYQASGHDINFIPGESVIVTPGCGCPRFVWWPGDPALLPSGERHLVYEQEWP